MIEPDDSMLIELELDELWSFVLKKSRKRSCLDRTVPGHATNHRIRYRRPQRGHLPKALEEDTAGLPIGALLHRFLGGLSKCHPSRSAHSLWQGQWYDRARRAMEQHSSPTAWSFCEKDVVVLKVGSDARDLSAIVHSSLQSIVAPELAGGK